MGIKILTAQLIPGPEWDMYLIFGDTVPHLFLCFVLRGDHVYSSRSELLNVSLLQAYIFLVFLVKRACRHTYISQKVSEKKKGRWWIGDGGEAKYMLLAKCILMPVIHLVTLQLLSILNAKDFLSASLSYLWRTSAYLYGVATLSNWLMSK